MKIKQNTILVFSVLLLSNLTASITMEDIYRDIIVNNVSLLVPSEYNTVQDAFLFLDDKRIGSGVKVTIQLEDGIYTNYETIEFTHTQSDRIELIGNPTSPSNVVIKFGDHFSGIRVKNTKTASLIDGITLDGNSVCGHGLEVQNCSHAQLGANVIIQNFQFDGIYCSMGSTVRAIGILVKNNGRAGIQAYQNSTVIISDSIIENNNSYGVASQSSSVVHAANTTSRNNAQQGFIAYKNSYMYAIGSISTGNSINYQTQDTSYITK